MCKRTKSTELNISTRLPVDDLNNTDKEKICYILQNTLVREEYRDNERSSFLLRQWNRDLDKYFDIDHRLQYKSIAEHDDEAFISQKIWGGREVMSYNLFQNYRQLLRNINEFKDIWEWLV